MGRGRNTTQRDVQQSVAQSHTTHLRCNKRRVLGSLQLGFDTADDLSVVQHADGSVGSQVPTEDGGSTRDEHGSVSDSLVVVDLRSSHKNAVIYGYQPTTTHTHADTDMDMDMDMDTEPEPDTRMRTHLHPKLEHRVRLLAALLQELLRGTFVE